MNLKSKIIHHKEYLKSNLYFLMIIQTNFNLLNFQY